jgi:DNA-binding MarR family transcriptional regulator
MEGMPTSADSPASTPDLGDLMHVAFRRLRRGWSEQLAPFDLTPYQFRALQAVARGPQGQGCPVHAGACRPELHPPGAHGLAGATGELVAGSEVPGGEAGSEVTGGAADAADAADGADAVGTTAAAGGSHSAVDAAEGMRLKDLAERLRIAPRSATEVVDQLQDKGLVERRPDPADRRVTRIVLTEDGARVREQVREERRRQAGDYFSVLSAPDRAELARILSELVRSHP